MHTPPADRPSSRPILIIEDHRLTTLVMARLVKARGFEVLVAGSAAEARQIAKDHDISFVITDLGLADGDGWQLMAELHGQKGIKGAAISGYGTASDLERSRAAGFIMHLIKPISVHQLDSLLELVRRDLDESEPLPSGPH